MTLLYSIADMQGLTPLVSLFQYVISNVGRIEAIRTMEDLKEEEYVNTLVRHIVLSAHHCRITSLPTVHGILPVTVDWSGKAT